MSGVPRLDVASIQSLLGDPITSVLLENSSFTRIQFETFLIDVLGGELMNRTLSGEEKTLLRIERRKISRGAFNRTLAQARQNVVRSLYTVFLLGYVGIFDTPELEPFIEVASRIRRYAADQLQQDDRTEQMADLKNSILEELHRSISQLAHFRIEGE